MKDNNIIESKHVGWGILQEEISYIPTNLEVAGLENISKSIKIKKLTLQLIDKKKFCYRHNAPVICAMNTLGNQTLSKVYTYHIYNLVSMDTLYGKF